MKPIIVSLIQSSCLLFCSLITSIPAIAQVTADGTTSTTVSFDGEDQDGNPSGAFSSVQPGAEGDAGGVTIITGSLDLTNEAELSTSTFGQGNAGTVTIDATDRVSFDNGSAFSGVDSEAVGDAGGVIITTDNQ